MSGELWVLTRAVHTTSLVILTPVPSMGTAQTLQTPTLRLRGNGTCPGSRASKRQRQLESKAKLFLLLLLRQVLCPRSPRPQCHPPGKPRAVGKGTGVSASLGNSGLTFSLHPTSLDLQLAERTASQAHCCSQPMPSLALGGEPGLFALGP